MPNTKKGQKIVLDVENLVNQLKNHYVTRLAPPIWAIDYYPLFINSFGDKVTFPVIRKQGALSQISKITIATRSIGFDMLVDEE